MSYSFFSKLHKSPLATSTYPFYPYHYPPLPYENNKHYKSLSHMDVCNNDCSYHHHKHFELSSPFFHRHPRWISQRSSSFSLLCNMAPSTPSLNCNMVPPTLSLICNMALTTFSLNYNTVPYTLSLFCNKD